MTRKFTRLTSVIFVLGMLAACQAPTVIHKGAARGAQMTEDLRGELRTMVKAQDALYEARLDNMVRSINDLYDANQQYRLRQEARAFATANASANAKAIEKNILGFMETSMTAWSKRHADYENRLAKARKTFTDNKKAVEADEAKLRSLRAKFLALSDPKTQKGALLFLIAFAKEVKADLDRRKADAATAAGSTSP